MLLVMLMTSLAPDETALMAAYRERTRADLPCRTTAAQDEITVCGRREADRYRISFVGTDPRDSVPRERALLLKPPMNDCGRIGQTFAGCGFAGVTVSTNGSAVRMESRKLAP